jgi:cytochrome P450
VLGIDEQLVARNLWRDPYPLFAQWRKDAPVRPFPGTNGFIVSTHDLVAEATSRIEDFSNHFRYTLFSNPDGTLAAIETGAVGPDVFAGEDPPLHTEQRKIFVADLNRSAIEALEPYVTTVADDLLDGLLSAPRGDAATDFAHALPLKVITERIIAYADVDLAQLRRWVFEGSRLTGGLVTIEQMADAAGDVVGMVAWTNAQLDAAVASKNTRGLLGVSATAVHDGRLTAEEAAFNLMVLVGAGAETTTSLIGIAIGILAERRDLQAELRADPSRVGAYVDEVLRYDSPFRYHPRTAARDTELGGVAIPRGALVLLVWASANRDPAAFDHPDELIIGRPNAQAHTGFGRGIHRCIGAPLARLEARIALTRLLARTASFSLDPDRRPVWSASIWIHSHDELPLVFTPQ